MRKTLLLFIIIQMILPHLLSQSLFPNAYEFKTDTAEWNIIPHNYWQILEDKTGKLTLNEVSKDPFQKQFHDSTTGTDRNTNVYWLRYKIKNATNNISYISLDGAWSSVDIYTTGSTGKLKHFITGETVDWNQRDGYKYSTTIPDTLRPDEERTVYMRLQGEDKGLPSNFGVGFYNTAKIIKTYYIDYVEANKSIYDKVNLQEAFIIGMVLLAAFMNFFFYRIVKEKVYLYFALYALFVGANRLWGISSNYFYFYHHRYSTFTAYLGYAWIFISIFLVQFFRNFLNSRKNFPKTDKLLLTFLIVFVVLSSVRIVAGIFDYQLPAVIRTIAAFSLFCLIPFTLIILQIVSSSYGTRANKFVMIGSFPLLIQFVLSIFFVPDGFYLWKNSAFAQFFLVNFRMIEAVILAILLITFTWVLFMRFIDLRKENAQQALDKERLAKEKEIERNELIAKQKIQLEKDVAERTIELRQSLNELKATQAQLIQSEKMASLGELTAGIAHEIQNPLNFVNNFSEVNKELLEELKAERLKPNAERDGSAEEEIINDVIANSEKINHHGKRADAIVKGMLQHSRSSSGQKEPTNINTLADEYLRLAYHGLRAKDKEFNATMKTGYDENAGNINIIPQDIGRVILNLITNAFYAVTEKKKQSGEKYEPTVSVSTKKINNKIEIRVGDNGNGVPQNVLEKIFQPFFTTKPTGQGTGLGLSLSYDIIKAHSGEIKVETKENEGTTFIIQLPVI